MDRYLMGDTLVLRSGCSTELHASVSLGSEDLLRTDISTASELPLTPPLADEDDGAIATLNTAISVLTTEAAALSCLARLYETDPGARNGFLEAVDKVSHSMLSKGKLVVLGVGKSGKIGEKIVATMNSLGIVSIFLHPVEALHGDMGIVKEVI
jgi:hypothetical protein